MTSKEKELTEMLEIAKSEIKDLTQIRDDLRTKIQKSITVFNLIESNITLLKKTL